MKKLTGQNSGYDSRISRMTYIILQFNIYGEFDFFLLEMLCLHLPSFHKYPSRNSLKIMLTDENGDCIGTTSNVVYKEIF